MIISELIKRLKEYPPDMQVMLYDNQDDKYIEPGFEKVDVIQVTDCGSEIVVDVSRKYHFGEGVEFTILALR